MTGYYMLRHRGLGPVMPNPNQIVQGGRGFRRLDA